MNECRKPAEEDDSIIIQEVMAKALRYNQWIYTQFEKTIGKRILDVGCSIGNLTEKYIDQDKVIAFEVVEESANIIRERFQYKPQFTVYLMSIEDPRVLTVTEADLDTAICVNVIEHVENDVRALQHMAALMISGGWLNLFVPAGPTIFGTMDATDGHFRRYTKTSLHKVVETAGFEIVKLYYFNILGFFGWWWNGRVRKKKYIDARDVCMMEFLVPVLRSIESIMPLPFGQSLVCVARKSSGAKIH